MTSYTAYNYYYACFVTLKVEDYFMDI